MKSGHLGVRCEFGYFVEMSLHFACLSAEWAAPCIKRIIPGKCGGDEGHMLTTSVKRPGPGVSALASLLPLPGCTYCPGWRVSHFWGKHTSDYICQRAAGVLSESPVFLSCENPGTLFALFLLERIYVRYSIREIKFCAWLL